MHAELILDARNATGESPVWSAAEQALYWGDIPARRLHRWGAAGLTRADNLCQVRAKWGTGCSSRLRASSGCR